MSYWFEKYIVEVTAIFQSVLVIFSNSDIYPIHTNFIVTKRDHMVTKNLGAKSSSQRADLLPETK